MTLGGSLETSSVSSFLLNPPRDPKDPQPETRFAAMSTQAGRAGNANRVGPPVAARSSLRRNVMLPPQTPPLAQKASAPESLACHDSAASSKKRADYGVYLPCYGPRVPDNSGFLWNSLVAGKRASARVKPREQIRAFGPKLSLSSARRRNSLPRDGG